MRVLLLAESYPPVVNSGARLFSELAADLRDRGHAVTVLAPAADRYLAGGAPAEPPPVFSRVREEGIDVWRLRRPPLARHVPVLRGLEQVAMGTAFLAAGLALSPQQAVIAYSPPLPYALAGWALGRLWGARVIVNVQDLYPETPVVLGLMKSRLAIGAFESASRLLYRRADAVTVHSDGNRRHVEARGGRRVLTIPNWVDLSLPAGGGAEFRRSRALREDAFVVSYAGVMGFGQGLEDVVDAAARLRGREDILFALAGDGLMRPRLEDRVKSEGLANVRFLPTLPGPEYLRLMDASDACLVTLNPALRTPVVPGKLASVMAAGRAAVCSVPRESDVWRILGESRGGLCVAAGESGELARVLGDLASRREEARAMGRRGRAYAERHFDRRTCTAAYGSLLEEPGLSAARPSG
jgi:colanic acid biosynthesis glycosyl transferase WcaI